MKKPNQFFVSLGRLVGWIGLFAIAGGALYLWGNNFRSFVSEEFIPKIIPVVGISLLYCAARELEKIRKLLEYRQKPDRFSSDDSADSSLEESFE
jgi:hypothetical protein